MPETPLRKKGGGGLEKKNKFNKGGRGEKIGWERHHRGLGKVEVHILHSLAVLHAYSPAGPTLTRHRRKYPFFLPTARGGEAFASGTGSARVSSMVFLPMDALRGIALALLS